MGGNDRFKPPGKGFFIRKAKRTGREHPVRSGKAMCSGVN